MHTRTFTYTNTRILALTHANNLPAFAEPGRSFVVLWGSAADPWTPQGGAACAPGKAWGTLMDSTSFAGLPTVGC